MGFSWMVHVRWSVTVVGEMNSLNSKSVEVHSVNISSNVDSQDLH